MHISRIVAHQMLDVFCQRSFPSLLTMVGVATEFSGIKAEFSRHLDLGVRQMIPLAGVNPDLKFVGYPVFLSRATLSSWSYLTFENRPDIPV
jgi:hypothetical protein